MIRRWGVFYLSGFLLATCVAGSSFAAESASPASPPTTGNTVVVQEIELLGVKAVSPEEIEASIEVATGVPLDRNALIRTAENIRQLYQARGYEAAGVRTELNRKKSSAGKLENVLDIFVSEGTPTRVAQFEFNATANVADWPERKLGLEKKLSLKVGDLYDQEKVQVARRALQDELASQEYVGARVVDVKLEESSPPDPKQLATLEGFAPDTPAKWVKMVFLVELGDRVTFGFQGNTVFSRTDIVGWIDDMRAVGFSTDYVAAIRDRIMLEYRNSAYGDVQVSVYTFEGQKGVERHVSYQIIEGTRVQIGRTEFDGNQSFTSEDLRRQFFKTAPLLTSRNYYVEAEVSKAADILIEWVRSRGYLGARLASINRSYDELHHVMNLTFYVYEGDQTRVDRIDLKGVNAVARDRALQVLGVRETEPLNLYAFSEGIDALKQEYRNLGYLDVKIRNEDSDQVVKYAQENRVADIHLEVEEGPKFVLSSVQIEGLTQTREDIVRREVAVEPGGVLTDPAIQKTDIHLKRLGIFSRVILRAIPDPERADGKILQISIDEADPGVLSGGFGVRTDLGYRIFGQVAYTNLWEKNHTASFTAATNQRFFTNDFCERNRSLVGDSSKPFSNQGCFLEFQAETAYNWPWFAGLSHLNFHPQFDVERTMYLNFSKIAGSFAATFSRPLLEKPALTAALTYRLERVIQFNAISAVDNQGLTIGSVTPSMSIDLRDNPLLPNYGVFATAAYEIANPAFLSQLDPFPVGFTSATFRSDFHYTFFDEIHAFFSFRTGIQRNTEAPPTDAINPLDYRIPISRQFSLGGVGSLRGFQEGGLNVDQIAIRGYLSYVNYRTQIDFPFAGSLRFGPFLDAANLLVDSYNFGDLRYGAGFGFHFRSPVGPVNFDWGFNLSPRAGEDENRFYFSIGVL